MPTVTDAQLRAIVNRHVVGLDGPILRMRSTGVVHALWTLGPDLVLRVPKDEPMCLADHRCESVAIPLARHAGVRTPELHVFDDTLAILDVPFSIVGRVHGTDLSGEPFDQPAYQGVGRELAVLHGAPVRDAHHHPWLRESDEHQATALFDAVLEAGLLHRQGVAWLRALSARLDEAVASGPPAPTTFTHGDVKPDNVMVDLDGDVHLIDWGDAGLGDPAGDFASLPMHSIELALDGYRAVRTEDPLLETRILRRVVTDCAYQLRRTPRTGPSWYRPIAARLTDVLTYAVDRPEVWERWTGASPGERVRR